MHSFITISILALVASAVAKRGCRHDPNNEGSGWYQVVSGDTLNDIAADFGSDADTLAAASGIANKDVIFPGDMN
ncbi:hypothetical protein Daus18300_005265 [Diaporthe australafricana]|uniref:LysM domain-containing protein n=1 Tax=Diaporthe australafricana TaxID=127596 RepID=A0ABR3X2N7_9PEZI